jgi:hypothetical protein
MINIGNKTYNFCSVQNHVISVVKRISGDKNQSRSYKLRNKETKLKNLCYDIYHYIKMFNIEIQI